MNVELSEIINSPGLWIASSIMVIAVIVQAVVFFISGHREANRLEIPKDVQIKSMRSAMITSIGPSIAMVVVLISLITVLGAPTTWMRLNDIGAARTELSVTTLSSGLLGVTPGTDEFGVEAFTFSLWGMALNNFGWLFVTFALTGSMSKGVAKLNQRFNPKMVKLIMSGTMFGIFGYLFINSFWGKATFSYSIVAAAVSSLMILAMNKVFRKLPRLQELSLGIAMLVGMFAAVAVQYALAA